MTGRYCKPYRILHVMTRLPVGGVEHQLLNVIRHYDRSAISPLVCSLSDKGLIGAEIEAMGVEVIELGLLGHTFKWSIASELARILKERGIHIVRTHQYHANLYGRLAAILAHTPCIVASVHNQYTQDRKPHRRFLNHMLSTHTDALIAVSDAVKSDIVHFDRIAPERVTVIPNGVDTDVFSAADRARTRRSLGLSDDVQVIGSVGRLTDQKGHVHLIEALASIKDSHPNVRALIVGEGPLRDALEASAVELGVHDRVMFAGMRRDIPELLAAMDLYVMPSLWEGMSNALIEAMAAGKPMAVSAIPSFSIMLRDGHDALLVPPKDPCALADALKRLLSDNDLAQRLGSMAKEKAQAEYSIKATVARYTNLYTGILESKSGAAG